MSGFSTWDNVNESKIQNKCLSLELNFKSPGTTPRPLSPRRQGETILNKYIDLISSKSNVSTHNVRAEPLDKPFDFNDDDEFAFGINLINKNVACVGDNISQLIQMAQEPWPNDVKLFQPYEVEQILLPDNASCLAVQAFLKMCNLPFEVEMRWNAEFMSPSGRVPFIKCGAFVVSELEPIVQFAANKGVTLSSELSTEEKAELRAYMSLITNVLVNAELYISWLDQDTFNTVTRVRNSSVYPWPLGWLQTRAKRNTVAKRLKALHWHDKTLDQVLADVEQCCNSLSQRLGDKDYFFGTPTALDALVYAHIRALLSANGPKADLFIRSITSTLLRHALKMTNLTKMTLTSQEEYLLCRAFELCDRHLSPVHSTSERTTLKRSRLYLRRSRDSLIRNSRDVFGFKPFASKQIIIMRTKEGQMTCRYDFYEVKQETVDVITEIIEDILDKIEENVLDEFAENFDSEYDCSNFEFVTLPNEYIELEKEVSDAIDGDINMTDVVLDSDGMVNDNLLFAEVVLSESLYGSAEVTNSSSDTKTKEYLELSSSGDGSVHHSAKSVKSTKSITRTPLSGSDVTLKPQRSDEISVESLLKCLRRRNAAYSSCIKIADID